jgi:hypothetical protein
MNRLIPVRGLAILALLAGVLTFSVPEVASADSLTDPPAKFDLRVDGYPGAVGPVRDQGSYGTCWAFAATASARSSLARNTGNPVDLSPRHLVYASYGVWGQNVKNPLSIGGWNDDSIRPWAKWWGVQPESAYPYGVKKAQMPITSESQIKSSAYHLRNAYKFPAPVEYASRNAVPENRKVIKQALMNYGVLDFPYYDPRGSLLLLYMSKAVNSKTYAMYNPKDKIANHAVALIGWDDTFPAANFGKGDYRPPGDGAWLIQGSWGPGSDDSGYLWISYYDKSTYNELAYYDVYPADQDYDHLYLSSGNMATITIPEDAPRQILEAVSYTVPKAGASYDLSVYLNPTFAYASGTQADIGAGEALNKTGTFTFAGHNRVTFDHPVYLNPGDTFLVVTEADSGSVYLHDALTKDASSSLCSGTLAMSGLPAAAGSRLEATGLSCPGATLSYRWQSAGEKALGTGAAYTAKAGDVDSVLWLQVTASKSGSTETYQTSTGIPVTATPQTAALGVLDDGTELTATRNWKNAKYVEVMNDTGHPATIKLLAAPDFVTLTGNKLQLEPTDATPMTRYQITVLVTAGGLSTTANFFVNVVTDDYVRLYDDKGQYTYWNPPATKTALELRVNTNGDAWKVTAISGSWISVNKKSANAEKTIKITVAKNTGQTRSGSITFQAGDATMVLNINQAGK